MYDRERGSVLYVCCALSNCAPCYARVKETRDRVLPRNRFVDAGLARRVLKCSNGGLSPGSYTCVEGCAAPVDIRRRSGHGNWDCRSRWSSENISAEFASTGDAFRRKRCCAPARWGI